MKVWLKRKIRNWLNSEDDCVEIGLHPIRTLDEPDSNCLRFKVFKASGGLVVQTDNYDRKTDRQHNTLHVIIEGQDLGTELGKIITFESLKL